jgi:hypothetical protein
MLKELRVASGLIIKESWTERSVALLVTLDAS